MATRTSLDPGLAALLDGTTQDPFGVLGPHADPRGGFVVRAFHPAAKAVGVRARGGEVIPMSHVEDGLYEGRLADAADYRLLITYHSGQTLEVDAAYRFGRVLTDFDLHLLGEGTHHRAYEKLGAHRVTVGTAVGVHFAVWAPNAHRVSVVGDFNGWDGRVHVCRLL